MKFITIFDGAEDTLLNLDAVRDFVVREAGGCWYLFAEYSQEDCLAFELPSVTNRSEAVEAFAEFASQINSVGREYICLESVCEEAIKRLSADE